VNASFLFSYFSNAWQRACQAVRHSRLQTASPPNESRRRLGDNWRIKCRFGWGSFTSRKPPSHPSVSSFSFSLPRGAWGVHIWLSSYYFSKNNIPEESQNSRPSCAQTTGSVEMNNRGRGKKPRLSKAERKQRAIARKADEQRKRDLAWAKEQEEIQEEAAKNKDAEEHSKAVRRYLSELVIEPQCDGALLLSKIEDDTLLLHLMSFLRPPDVVSVSCGCRRLWKLSVDDYLWKPFALDRWPELSSTTEIDDWKLLYRRKHKEETKYGDFMQSFGKCDWYACPNGHPYMIGECRKPMKMARCAVCKELIGGREHKMLANNQRIGAVAPKKGGLSVDASVRLSELNITDTFKDSSHRTRVDTMEPPRNSK